MTERDKKVREILEEYDSICWTEELLNKCLSQLNTFYKPMIDIDEEKLKEIINTKIKFFGESKKSTFWNIISDSCIEEIVHTIAQKKDEWLTT